MNNKIKQFCKDHNLTENQFYGKEEISGSLGLGNLTSIPDGFNPTVGGSLGLGNLTSIPDGFNPTVGGSLYLGNLTSIPVGFNPTVGVGLYLSSLTSIPSGFNPTVGGSLDLRSMTSIPSGFNPTVGVCLYLSSLTSIPDGFNPTVGGGLYLSSLTSIPSGFNPTVGGSLDLRQGLTAETKPYGNPIIKFQNGKYIKADGMFTEVLNKKGNVYTVRNLNRDKVYYLATDGKNTHAHGDTIAQAKTDLRFKKIAEKLKSAPIKPDTMINVQYYRIVTGACEAGCRQWLDRNGIIATEIKASELIVLLEKTNAYGASKFKSLLTA